MCLRILAFREHQPSYRHLVNKPLRNGLVAGTLTRRRRRHPIPRRNVKQKPGPDLFGPPHSRDLLLAAGPRVLRLLAHDEPTPSTAICGEAANCCVISDGAQAASTPSSASKMQRIPELLRHGRTGAQGRVDAGLVTAPSCPAYGAECKAGVLVG